MTVQEFIKENGLSIEAISVPENPNLVENQEWKADHWYCRIIKADKRVVVYFSKGLGLRKKSHFFPDGKPIPPTLPEVLESLYHDCSVLGCTFEDWASDCGYDEDSRSAEQMYKTCCQIARKLRKFLGGKAFADLQSIEF